jgi:site-specific recombinase XerD
MADAGVPLSVVQGILGHSDIKTTMRYVHVMDDDKRQAVSALEKGGWKNGLVK